MNKQAEILDIFFEFDLQIRSRTLFMGTKTDAAMAEKFLKGMVMLSSSKEPITIIMNNEGGDEYTGLAIYDAISTCKCHVTIIVYGCAMSMGSWILQAADERILAPRSTVMIHYGVWGEEDHVKYYRVHAVECERLNALMENDYLAKIRQVHPRYTAAKLKRLLENETYLSAKEAIELGLADRILEER